MNHQRKDGAMLKKIARQIILHRKKITALTLIGVVVAFWLQKNIGLTGPRFLSDLFFILAMVFLICSLGELIGNLGTFNSLKYSFKNFQRLLKNQKMTPEEKKDGYFAYVNSRPRYRDVAVMMFFSVLFIAISLGISLIAC
jgi:ABC-type siderophore export system fused ATPase/permease subunit